MVVYNLSHQKKDVELMIRRIRELEDQRESLKIKIWRLRKKPSRIIGFSLIGVGCLALVTSIIYVSIILCFIGLGLSLWGSLLLYVIPARYIKSELYEHTVPPLLSNLNRILLELGYHGKGIYFSPQTLKAHARFNETLLIIPAQNEIFIPQTEQLTDSVFLENMNAVSLTPTGLDLAMLIEEELGVNLIFSDIALLQDKLMPVLVEDLEVMKDFNMNIEREMVHVEMKQLAYKDLCKDGNQVDVCLKIACPLCSSIACILARVTGKPVTIEKRQVNQEDNTVEVDYRLIKL